MRKEFEKLNEEALEQATGGLNTNGAKIGGFLDHPGLTHTIMDDSVDAIASSPLMGPDVNRTSSHPVIKRYIDTALPEDKDRPTLA